jgi:hypothetical protein
MLRTCRDGKSSKTISEKLSKSNLGGWMSTPVRLLAQGKCRDGLGSEIKQMQMLHTVCSYPYHLTNPFANT